MRDLSIAATEEVPRLTARRLVLLGAVELVAPLMLALRTLDGSGR